MLQKAFLKLAHKLFPAIVSVETSKGHVICLFSGLGQVEAEQLVQGLVEKAKTANVEVKGNVPVEQAIEVVAAAVPAEEVTVVAGDLQNDLDEHHSETPAEETPVDEPVNTGPAAEGDSDPNADDSGTGTPAEDGSGDAGKDPNAT